MSTTARFDGIERDTGASPAASIIWLHGLGADASDFLPIIPALLRPQWPALRFVFPNAPVRPVSLNGGMPMRAWYDLYGLDAAGPVDEPGVRQAVAALQQLIEREIGRGIAAGRIVLAGFSQGGSVAMASLLRQPVPLGGAILLSCWLPLANASRAEADPGSRSTPVFMAHGRADDMVSYGFGEQSAGFLRELGYPLDWHSYPDGHTVGPQAIDDIGRWLDQRIAGWT
jgi:phospholipase/carboxylesterase